MRCPECGGMGTTAVVSSVGVVNMPCSLCNGCGLAHCCDGETCQPDAVVEVLTEDEA